MRSFFEDTGIVLVLSVAIYGGYFVYTTFLSDDKNLPNTIEYQEKIVIVKKEPLVDDNSTIQIEKIMPEVSIEKVEKKELKKVKIEIQEVTNVTLPLIKQEIEQKKEKNVDLAMLRIFLSNIKFEMASNIIKRDDITENISQELKIRVTVLPDGNYEEFMFVSGDKKLFEINKKNILRVFPIHIDDKIKDDFPRYVRISIK